MRVIIPMAGRGGRFEGSAWDRPKPLIDVEGRPMVAWAADSLRGLPASAWVFVVLEDHERRYGVRALLRKFINPDAQTVVIPEVTEGQLCTVLAARPWIAPDEDLLIASSDTFIMSQIGEDIRLCGAACRGLISVAKLPGDRWSFARTDASGAVVEVAEKRRISEWASTGLYYFSRGREFLENADEILAERLKEKGEYYVIPVYGRMIARGQRIELSIASKTLDMGTPEELRASKAFLQKERPPANQ